MIFIIAPNPFKDKDREGYLQRVASIDNILEGHKIYYSGDFCSSEQIAKMLVKADHIYVHSIYQAELIIDCYQVFGHKIITDLHGVVPEEEYMRGEHRRSRELGEVEKKVFEHGSVFIAVTSAMKEHYIKKYSWAKSKKWILLPIFTDVSTNKDISNKIPRRVVYAGGAQKWQNVDLIIETINKSSSEYSYDILTKDKQEFTSINKKEKVKIFSIEHTMIYSIYLKSELGFVLRDDNLVNRVACPTKLVEYLAYGVVPVIKSSNIGDFDKMGYKYFNYEDVINNAITNQKIDQYRSRNYEVIEKLMLVSCGGINELENILKKHNDKPMNIEMLVESAINNSVNTKELNATLYQVAEQIKIINEYAKAVEYYRNNEKQNPNTKKKKLFKVKFRKR